MLICSQCNRPNDDACRYCVGCGEILSKPPVTPVLPPIGPAAAPPIILTPRPARSPLLWLGFGLGLAAALAVIVILAAGAFYLFHSSSPAPPIPIVTPTPVVAPPQDPVLVTKEKGIYLWGPPSLGTTDSSRLPSLFFDNGTPNDLTVSIEARAELTVPAGQRIVLRCRPGKLSFTVSGDQLETPDQLAVTLEETHVYVYNPLAAWDYTRGTHVYSVSGVEGGPHAEAIRGAVFFDAGSVDDPFTPAPAQVTTSSFFNVTRYSLSHQGDQPHDDRTCRRIKTPSGDDYRIVTWPDGPVVVQSAASPLRTASVFVDNPYRTDVRLLVDGTLVCEIKPDSQQPLYVFAGEHHLTVARFDGTQLSEIPCTIQEDAQYVWVPEARRAFAVDYRRYGTALVFQSNSPEIRDSVTMRGFVFFQIHTQFAFEDFPDTVPVSVLAGDVWKSRLSVGDIVADRASVRSDLNAAEEQIRRELSPEQWRTFKSRQAKREDPLTDCDRYLAQALAKGLQGDEKAAAYLFEVVAAFEPQRADIYRLRGLMLRDLKEEGSAAYDLGKAMDMDSSLEAQLKPLFEECRAAADKKNQQNP